LSKEIAQTVGGKRIAWLLAIVAAFAVMATLGTQWRSSEAAYPAGQITIAQTTVNPDPGATIAYTVTLAFTPSGTVNSDGNGDLVLDFDDDLIEQGVSGTSTGAIDANEAAADCSVAAGNV
jgi:hypothetical protein